MKRFAALIVLFLLPVAAHADSSSAQYDYVRGLLEERAGHNSKALEAYQKVVSQNPQAIGVYRDIALLQLRMGHAADALKSAEKIKDLAPKDPNSFLFLGEVHVAEGNLAKANEAFEQALKLDPTNVAALENLGNYYAMIDPPKALVYYQRYLDVNPNDAEVYFQMGEVRRKMGKLKEALADYQKSAALDPGELAPPLAMADLFEEQHSTAAAIEQYQRCVQLHPRDPSLFVRLGRLYYEDHQWDQAASQFQNAAVVAPEEPSIYYWLARIAEERKQWNDAARFTEKAYQLSHDPQFMPLIAYYLTLGRRSEDATKWLEKAKKADPKNANVHLFLGMDYLDMNKPDKAEAALKAGLALAPKDAQMHFQMGVAQDTLGETDAAMKEFQTVLTLDPQNAAAMNYLAYSWAEHGTKLEEAEALLRKAIKIDPDNGAYEDSLGWVLYKRSNYADAVKWLEKAVKHTPDPLIYNHLGDAYWAQNDVAQALKAWNQSLAMDPKNTEVRKKAGEAAQRVIPGADRRKYLKYIEGNMRQIHDLHSLYVVQGRWRRAPLNSAGNFYYLRPDEVLMEAAGAGKEPALQVYVKGSTVTINPPSMRDAAHGMPMEQLVLIPEFFSGDLTVALDSPTVRTDLSNDAVHYRSPSCEAWVDRLRGVLTRLSRANPVGGTDELEFNDYALVDGLWLPAKMRLRNRTLGWDARLSFSNWVVNDPDALKAFGDIH